MSFVVNTGSNIPTATATATSRKKGYIDMNKTSRYRPIFTATQIKVALKAIKIAYAANLVLSPEDPNTMNLSEEATCLEVIRKLATLHAKIEADAITPEYTSTSPADRVANKQAALLDSLGANSDNSSPGDRRKAAYTKYARNKSLCSPAELADAVEHMFLNGLMSSTEEEAYAKKKDVEFSTDNNEG